MEVAEVEPQRLVEADGVSVVELLRAEDMGDKGVCGETGDVGGEVVRVAKLSVRGEAVFVRVGTGRGCTARVRSGALVSEGLAERLPSKTTYRHSSWETLARFRSQSTAAVVQRRLKPAAERQESRKGRLVAVVETRESAKGWLSRSLRNVPGSAVEAVVRTWSLGEFVRGQRAGSWTRPPGE
jgi:hypothetical protein